MKKLFAVVMAMMLLLSCGAFAELDTTIPEGTSFVFWHSFTGANEATLVAQIAEFEAQNPGIDVQEQYIGGYNVIHTELASANAAKVGVPALSVINVPRLTSYANDALVEDLTPYIEAFADEINFADFYDGMVDMMKNGDHQTALPFGQSGQIFYYNKTLLDSLNVTFPTKTEDMEAFLETVYNATQKPVIEIHGTDNAYFYCLFTNMGAYMIDTETNTTGLDSDVAKDLAAKLRSWVDKGYIKWVINDVANTMLLDFTSGNCASVLYTSSVYASYKQKAESGANGLTFEVGIANQPFGANGTNHQYVAGATMIIPAAECNTQAQKNAAFKLICFLTAPEQQLEWATTSSYYVTRKSASTDPQYAEAYAALLEKLPEMATIDLNSYVAKTKHELFDKCGDIFEKYMSAIMADAGDLEENWDIMIEEINDTLADR
ncbi:MAG: extracellular solute-binding protein [Clostridia bacterium]|nr:extracellular solute-binding protein [Clostridia bacterium]